MAYSHAPPTSTDPSSQRRAASACSRPSNSCSTRRHAVITTEFRSSSVAGSFPSPRTSCCAAARYCAPLDVSLSIASRSSRATDRSASSPRYPSSRRSANAMICDRSDRDAPSPKDASLAHNSLNASSNNSSQQALNTSSSSRESSSRPRRCSTSVTISRCRHGRRRRSVQPPSTLSQLLA